jgi:inner membrane protein
MDSITQATLGAAIGQAMLGKKIGVKAPIVGAIVATIPDLDIVLLPFFDSLERLSIHRGFSHSILFSLLGGLLLALILSKMKWTKEFTLTKLFLFSWLALFTHMILDAFTTYGTQLFLPFNDYRVSFDSINIVDPFYTLPLLIGLIISVFQRRSKIKWQSSNRLGLFISSLYLIFTLVNKEQVNKVVRSELEKQEIKYNSLKSIPVGLGNFSWYGLARSNDTLFLGKYSILDREAIYFHSFPINSHLLEEINSDLAERLVWFAQNYYTVAKVNEGIRFYNLQCDMQGVRMDDGYKAPTAFYFEVTPFPESSFELNTGMHKNNNK